MTLLFPWPVGSGFSLWPKNTSEPLSIPESTPVFMGVTEERGVWSERCQGCGQCILGKPLESVPYPGAPRGSSTAPVAVLHKENVK